MAEERVQVAIPKSTDNLVSRLSNVLDETKGKVIKKAVAEYVKREYPEVIDGGDEK